MQALERGASLVAPCAQAFDQGVNLVIEDGDGALADFHRAQLRHIGAGHKLLGLAVLVVDEVFPEIVLPTGMGLPGP